MKAFGFSIERVSHVPRKPGVAEELQRFLGGDSRSWAIVSRTFSTHELPNLQGALDRIIERRGATDRLLGYATAYDMQRLDLRALSSRGAMNFNVAPVVLRDVDVDVDQTVQCVVSGIHLIDAPSGRLAAHVHLAGFHEDQLQLEVLAKSTELAGGLIDEVRSEIVRSNIYSGKVLSFEQTNPLLAGPKVCFHRFPDVHRDDIVLPAATLDLIERNTVRFFLQSEALRRSGQSLKRGLLLHGKPGTGKTFTAKWLSRSLEGVTVILLAAEQLLQIKPCCQMARLLAPSLVIVEDVDLIAAERDERRPAFQQVALHQLLNEMDGLGDDAAVLFLLTTNRPEVLEPALRARPGRVDQAIEYPLPDADCRRRLIEIYGRGLSLTLARFDEIVAKTDGVSPAFIRELLRKAALVAAEDRSFDAERIRVTDEHLEAALRELLLGGELTQKLLGFGTPP